MVAREVELEVVVVLPGTGQSPACWEQRCSSKLNYMFSGHFDPTDITFNNRNK